MSQQTFRPLGSSYYPVHSGGPESWQRDLERMIGAGLHVVRTAEIANSWSYIESAPGVFEWGFLDKYFELAEKHDVKLLLGTGSNDPPLWLAPGRCEPRDRDAEDVRVISSDGVPYPTAGVYGWACRENPRYRERAKRFLEELMTRYGNHPSLRGYQIDNEPGFPLQASDDYCHCHHHVRAFRVWLKKKYERVEELNQAWSWIPTNPTYTSWEEVCPPRSLPQGWGVVTQWLDWRTFQYDALAEFIRWQARLIRGSHQRSIVISTNIFCWGANDVVIALDPWRLAETVDIVGYDLYPGNDNRFVEEPEYVSLFLSYGLSTVKQADRLLERTGGNFWLAELESGPTGGWALGPGHDTSDLDIKRFTLQGLAHGARQINYEGYRQWNCLPLNWGGLVDLSGNPTPRYDAVRLIDSVIARNSELFEVSEPVAAEIAILDDPASHVVLYGMGQDHFDFLTNAVRGCYQALWSSGYAVDFVTPRGLAGELPYKIIFLPFSTVVLSEETAESLRRFVDAGGTLVGFARTAWLDERGWLYDAQLNPRLEEVFGVEQISIEQTAETIEIQLDADAFGEAAATVCGYWHKQYLALREETEVLGTFTGDDSPAIVAHGYGQGRAFYVATHLEVAVIEVDPASNWLAARAVFRHFADAAGVVPMARIDAPGDERELALSVEARLLAAGERRLVIVTNSSATSWDLIIRLPGQAVRPAARDLFTGRDPSARAEGDDLILELLLAAWDGTVIVLSGDQ